ncbi:hypothetical protein F66182_5495 [Fusarium sp. NRRL 66182]|nr:hypothetical protein F66182_5495 [Fusarium sp. NRRL 66182]
MATRRPDLFQYPTGFTVLRIFQALLSIITIVVTSFTISVLIIPGNCLLIMASSATLLVSLWMVFAHMSFSGRLHNFWAALVLDMLLVVLWIISVAVLAAQTAPLWAHGSDYCKDNECPDNLQSVTSFYGYVFATCCGLGAVGFPSELPTAMDSDSTVQILPPSLGDALRPTTLLFSGQLITSEDAPSTPLYQISRELTCKVQKGTSIIFERVELGESGESDITLGKQRRAQDLFYLVHPANAQYRSDLPPYYITAASPGTLGNIQLGFSEKLLQKTGFEAMLNADKSAAHVLLFDSETQQTLFEIKPKWKGGNYQWMSSDGQKIAYESGKGDEHKLVIQIPLQQQIRDAMVALWILRLWHDIAESRSAKRQGKLKPVKCWYLVDSTDIRLEMEELAGPPHPSSYPDSKLTTRAGALGAFGGAGGAC